MSIKTRNQRYDVNTGSVPRSTSVSLEVKSKPEALSVSKSESESLFTFPSLSGARKAVSKFFVMLLTTLCCLGGFVVMGVGIYAMFLGKLSNQDTWPGWVVVVGIFIVIKSANMILAIYSNESKK